MRDRLEARDVTRATGDAPVAGRAPGAVQTLLGLQRTAGNAAVSRLVLSRVNKKAPTAAKGKGSVTVKMKKPHRGKRKSHIRAGPKPATVVADANGVVSVSTRHMDRPPGYGPGGSQWQHLTSYVSFEVLIEDRLRGVTWANVPAALKALVDKILKLPMMQIAPAQMWATAQGLKTRADNITGLANKASLEKLLYDIVGLRQLVPEAAVHRVPRHGRNESTHGPGLQAIERGLARGAGTAVTAADVAFSMWKLLDFHPTQAHDRTKAAAIIANHIASMEMTYPSIFAHFGDPLYDELVRQLKTSNQEAFKDVFEDIPGATHAQMRKDILDLVIDYVDNANVPAIGGAFQQALYVP